MEDGRGDKTPALPGRAGALEGEQDATARLPRKKRPSGSHPWRLSHPSPKSPLLDRAAGLQKSQSALNLASDRTTSRYYIIYINKFVPNKSAPTLGDLQPVGFWGVIPSHPSC